MHNNCLHHLPIAMAPAVPVPMLTDAAHAPHTMAGIGDPDRASCPVTFVAVSEHTARRLATQTPQLKVIRNGVDLDRWPAGPGGGGAIWFGRLVPGEGRRTWRFRGRRRAAGLELDLVGPL